MLRPIALVATGLLAAGSLAACGSSPTGTAAGGDVPSGGSSQGYGGAAGGTSAQQRFPGTSGTIADINGATVQVQNQSDGQVAVTYSATTTFTAQVAAALSDVKVGSCVSVTPAASSAGSGSASADAVTAGAVRISQPQDGSCTGGLSFARGARPSGRPGTLPSGAPGGAPRGVFLGGANGTVAAVTATGFTVTQELPDLGNGSASAGASPSMTTSTVTVTVDGSTTYSTTKPATSSALVVGKCVTATGTADDTGTIAATRMAVSAPENGQCGGFFSQSGPGGPAGSAAGGAAAGGAAPGGAA